jgi:CRISPR-associated protein Cas1
MSWRTVAIGQKAHLSLKHSQLSIKQEEAEHTVALEDVAAIILESHQSTLTTSLLSKAAQMGTMTIVCDEVHTPVGVYLPFHTHTRQAGVARKQLAWTKAWRAVVWRQIIRQKILNQAAVLEHTGHAKATLLRAMTTHVKPLDTNNHEAFAAKNYFPALFGVAFTRDLIMDTRNAALNYGYAIVRAAIARALVAYGFLPCVGIFHDNALNAFNLADDMIEPWRPMVDQLVYELQLEHQTSLEKDHRTALIGILAGQVRIGGQTHSFLNAVDKMAESLSTATMKNSGKPLLLPEL